MKVPNTTTILLNKLMFLYI